MNLKDPKVLDADLIETFENNGEKFYVFNVQYDALDQFKQLIRTNHYKIFQKFLENTGLADKAEELVERPTLTGIFEFKKNLNRVHLKLQFLSALFNGLQSIAIDAINLDAHKVILKGRLIVDEKQVNDTDLFKYFNKQLSAISIQTDFDLHVHSDVRFQSFDGIGYDEAWWPNDALGTLWFDCILTDDHYLSVGVFNHLADVKCQALSVVDDIGVQIDDRVENFENYKEDLVEVLTYGEFTWDISEGEMRRYIETLVNDFCKLLETQLNRQNLNELLTIAFTNDLMSD